METIASPRLGFLGGVFLANHLAITDNLTRTTNRQNIYKRKLLMIHKMVLNKQQHTKNMLSYVTDRTWFSRILRHPVAKRSGSTSYKSPRGDSDELSQLSSPPPSSSFSINQYFDVVDGIAMTLLLFGATTLYVLLSCETPLMTWILIIYLSTVKTSRII